MPPAPVTVAPLRALAGAGLSVAGVVLGIGALLLLTDAPSGPAVEAAAPVAVAVPVEPPAEPPPAEPDALVAAPPPEPRATEPPAPRAAPARPPLTVLNNSRITGLAGREAASLRSAGWDVAVVGNLRGRTRASTVYYAQGQRAAAERLARAADVPRVLPRREGLPGRGLTLVVTRDRG